jgi:peptide/nickel transport system substrate-binding protein
MSMINTTKGAIYGIIKKRLIVSIVFLTAISCGVISSAHAAKRNDTLNVAFQRGILSLDYNYTTKREYIILSELIDDGLFYTDPKTLKPVPLAAKSFKIIDDMTIDVVIREGIKFHDGSTLTADDVVYTYSWLLNDKSKMIRSKLFGVWLSSIEKTGPMSVRFNLKTPYALAIQALGRGVPLRRNGTYDAFAAKGKRPTGQSVNGIGPYKVVSFRAGKKTVLERFEDYYKDSSKGRPAIKRISIRAIPDWGTQQAELLSGGLDWMYSVPTDIAENAGATGRAKFIAGASMRIGFIILDAGGYTDPSGPLTKADVRRAIAHAINREAIVKYIVRGKSEVIHAACHPVQFGCTQDIAKYPYDPAKAKALLKAAGYPNGIKMELWAYREKEVAEAIAADLVKAGIKVKLRYTKLASLNKARKKRKIQSYFGTWASGSVADVAAIAVRHWSATTDRNLSKDSEVTALMLGGHKTTDVAKRKALYDKGLKRIADQALWIPLYAFTLNYLTSNDVVFEAPRDGFPRLHMVKWK